MAEPATAGSAGEAGTGTRVTIGIPKEITPGERRVSLIPETVGRLVKQGANVLVQAGAGEGAFFLDDAYQAAGAALVPDARTLYESADLVLKIHRPLQAEDGTDELALLRPGSALIAFLYPLGNPDLAQRLAERRITAFSMDAIPRTTRAQYMDALSAMSTVAGYKASLLAADHLAKFFPLLMTAAGTIAPAKVLIIGAGVAGLQAIGTCRRLGAVVEAYDARPVVKEQVESLGAKFVEIELGRGDTQTAGGYAREMTPEEIQRQQAGLAARAAQVDVVITTALVPGRPAPLLITEEAVRGMRPGSVIVDLAGETGGNCALSVPGETVVRHHVTIMAPLNLPSAIPVHASQMYAKNLQNLLALLLSKDGRFQPDWNDDIVAATVITRDGEIVHEGTRRRLGLEPLTTPEPEPAPPAEQPATAVAAATPTTTAVDQAAFAGSAAVTPAGPGDVEAAEPEPESAVTAVAFESGEPRSASLVRAERYDDAGSEEEPGAWRLPDLEESAAWDEPDESDALADPDAQADLAALDQPAGPDAEPEDQPAGSPPLRDWRQPPGD